VFVPAYDVGVVYTSILGLSAPIEAYAYLAFGTPAADYLTCGEALFPNFTVDVFDVVSRARIDSYAAGCSNPLPAFVYTGDLDLDDYIVRMKGFDPTSGAKVFDSCDVELAHFGMQIGVNGYAATLFTSPLPVCSTP